MSIPRGRKKINLIALIAISVVLGFILLFGGLKLYAFSGQKTPITIDRSGVVSEDLSIATASTKTPAKTTLKSTKALPAAITPSDGRVVASKTGSKYYLLTCTGAKAITEKNRVYFDSPAAAERAEYTPSATCKGLTQPAKISTSTASSAKTP